MVISVDRSKDITNVCKFSVTPFQKEIAIAFKKADAKKIISMGDLLKKHFSFATSNNVRCKQDKLQVFYNKLNGKQFN